LPKELVRDTLRAQFADCEVTRLRVLAVTWELERLQRWQKFYTRSLTFLKEQNNVSLESLEYWRSWCNDQGLDCYPHDRETLGRLLENECSTLEHMRAHFNCSEKAAVSLGVYDTKDLAQSCTTQYSSNGRDPNSSDPEGSETETLEIFPSSDMEKPPSDPGVFHYPSSSNSDVYVTSP